ncbi:MAG: hypothetical protein JWM80_4336 [Cyanobacteria bacterium RYN_339]|nr:hypothetical protein [Cyanobacteria bacterium RYN_339]
MKTIVALGLALALTGCWQMQAQGGGGGGGKAVAFQADVVPVLKAHCAACHTEGNPTVPFFMFNADGSANYANVQEHGTQMVDAVTAGRMPKGQPGSVAKADLAKLSGWVAAGSKDD